MIVGKEEYLAYIIGQGVGKKDIVASSPASYISYLNSVSRLLGEDISPSLVNSETAIASIIKRLEGQRAAKTLSNYRSALRQYFHFYMTRENKFN